MSHGYVGHGQMDVSCQSDYGVTTAAMAQKQRDAYAVGPANPRDDNGINGRVDRLNARAAHLHDCITELQQRLTPFTKPLPVSQEKNPPALPPPNSTVAHGLHDLEIALDAAIGRINELKYAVDH
jgi:hypothetical protein